MNQINTSFNEISLINLDNPQSQTKLMFQVSQETIVGDLLVFIQKNSSEEGKIDIYFTKDKSEPFKANYNLYLQKQLKTSQVYYTLDVKQKQIQSQYVNNHQESIQVHQDINNSAYNFKPQNQTYQHQQSIEQNRDQQNFSRQAYIQLEIKVQNLTNKLQEKEEQLQKLQQAFEEAQIQNKQKINEIENENNLLKQQIILSQQQKEHPKIQELQNQINSLFNQNREYNYKIESLMKQIEILSQKSNQNDRNDKKINISEQNDFQKKQQDLFQIYDLQTQETQIYLNKCGHKIEKAKLQEILYISLMNKTIARCQDCTSTFSSQICFQIETFGKQYIEMKLTLELPDLINNLRQLEHSYLNLVKCDNSNCKFFCLWKQSSHIRTERGFCPNCLQLSVKNPKDHLFLTNVLK